MNSNELEHMEIIFICNISATILPACGGECWDTLNSNLYNPFNFKVLMPVFVCSDS